MRARDYLSVYQRALAGYGNHNGGSFAAAIAYNAVFSIFPLILLAIAFLGFFLHGADQRQHVVDALFNVLGQGVGRDALRTQVDQLAGGNATLGVVGIVAATWSAMGVFDQIRTALNLIWDSNRPRPFVRQKLIDLGMLLTVGLLVLCSLLATGVLTALANFGEKIVGGYVSGGVHALFYIASIVVPIFISFCAFALLYWLVPHARIRIQTVWLGALTAAVAFEILQLVFATYVANFGHYNRTYGALGGIIALIFFIYLASVVTLLGAEIAKEYIDMLVGAADVTEAPRPQAGLREMAAGAIRGLFVDDSPHHDASVPYEPGRNEPLEPNARLETDGERQGSARRS